MDENRRMVVVIRRTAAANKVPKGSTIMFSVKSKGGIVRIDQLISNVRFIFQYNKAEKDIKMVGTHI